MADLLMQIQSDFNWRRKNKWCKNTKSYLSKKFQETSNLLQGKYTEVMPSRETNEYISRELNSSN